MSSRHGITTRPEELRAEWHRACPTMHAWHVFGPFRDREQAEAWEDQQQDSNGSSNDMELDFPGARWWGFRFDY
jgi:hypothetical protein